MSQKIIIPGQISLNQWVSDGDTLAFKADNLNDWGTLGVKPKPTPAKPYARVRLDGLDAPELHSDGRAQSSFWGRLATEHLWSLAGGDAVTWSITGNVPLNSETLAVRLEVVGVDKFRRVIGVLHPTSGDLNYEDSLNALLVRAGLAYPSPYETTPPLLVYEVRKSWAIARDQAAGFALLDSSQSFNIYDVAPDQADVLIHPKIWRRVSLFATNYASTESWEVYLKGRNDLYLPVTGKVQNLRKSLVRSGSVVTIDVDPSTAMWFTTGGLTASQILAFVSTIER